MPSFRTRIDPRRSAFLSLASQVESQLRDAYARKFDAGLATQTSVAEKLGIDRSAVHRRLTGRTNMTLETLADMAWALDQVVEVTIHAPRRQPASPGALTRVEGGSGRRSLHAGAPGDTARSFAASATRSGTGAAKEILARAGKRRRPRPDDHPDAN